MYLKYSSIMLGGKEVQLYLLFMLRKLHGKNPLNAYQTFVRLLSPLDQFFPNSKSCRCFSRLDYRGSTFAKHLYTVTHWRATFLCIFCVFVAFRYHFRLQFLSSGHGPSFYLSTNQHRPSINCRPITRRCHIKTI